MAGDQDPTNTRSDPQVLEVALGRQVRYAFGLDSRRERRFRDGEQPLRVVIRKQTPGSPLRVRHWLERGRLNTVGSPANRFRNERSSYQDAGLACLDESRRSGRFFGVAAEKDENLDITVSPGCWTRVNNLSDSDRRSR
jgi:hypothetical protein